MTPIDFDVVAHHRRRTRAAERRADSVELQRAKLERLLGLAVRTAAGDDCDPLVLLSALERTDERAQNRGASIDDLVALLRSTDPRQVAA